MIPGRNRRGGFKRRAPSAADSLEPAWILGITDLWGWWWGGDNGSRLTLSGDQITQVEDLSGNSNHMVAGTGDALYESDIVISDDATQILFDLPYPALMKHRENANRITFANGGDLFPAPYDFNNGSFIAAGAFYTIAINVFTRPSGTREYYGRSTTSKISCAQATDTNQFLLYLNSATPQDISTEAGPSGLVVFEIFRDASNNWFVVTNGTDISAGLTASGTVTWSGIGYDDEGSSRFDDYWMEHIMVNGSVPSTQIRTDLRNYLTSKWVNQA